MRRCDVHRHPADHSAELVDYEADVGDTGPGRCERQVGHPEPVRGRRDELPVHEILVPCGRGITLCRLDTLGPCCALDPRGTHQLPGLITTDIHPGTTSNLAEFADPVDAVSRTSPVPVSRQHR